MGRYRLIGMITGQAIWVVLFALALLSQTVLLGSRLGRILGWLVPLTCPLNVLVDYYFDYTMNVYESLVIVIIVGLFLYGLLGILVATFVGKWRRVI